MNPLDSTAGDWARSGLNHPGKIIVMVPSCDTLDVAPREGTEDTIDYTQRSHRRRSCSRAVINLGGYSQPTARVLIDAEESNRAPNERGRSRKLFRLRDKAKAAECRVISVRGGSVLELVTASVIAWVLRPQSIRSEKEGKVNPRERHEEKDESSVGKLRPEELWGYGVRGDRRSLLRELGAVYLHFVVAAA